jgi:hypothetical protein
MIPPIGQQELRGLGITAISNKSSRRRPVQKNVEARKVLRLIPNRPVPNQPIPQIAATLNTRVETIISNYTSKLSVNTVETGSIASPTLPQRSPAKLTLQPQTLFLPESLFTSKSLLPNKTPPLLSETAPIVTDIRLLANKMSRVMEGPNSGPGPHTEARGKAQAGTAYSNN